MFKNSLALLVFLVCYLVVPSKQSCDRFFLPTDDNQTRVSKFEAPSRLGARPFRVFLNEQGNVSISTNSSQEDQKPIHCLYKFIANDNERVALKFSSFRLRGDEPDCTREYIDIFVKLKPDDNLEQAIEQEPANGRFCTTIMPRPIVSLHNMLLLIIHSDLKPPANGKPLFTGTYEFIRSNSSDLIGQPEENSLCKHTIYSRSKREGEFQSITYPGVYVKGLRCSYKFIGEPNQRVRLEFLDLDLYSGGTHCPLDSIKIFDGLEESDPLINTICGSHRSLIVFSTHQNMLVTFSTMQRESEVQNRGFSAYFEFSDTYVDPSFIQDPHAKHIRGSECDQRIISRKGSLGVIISPVPKHHASAVCRYIFEGLQTSNDYEKVMLKFARFDLKTPHALVVESSTASTSNQAPPTATVGSQAIQTDSGSSNAANASVEQCTDNYVRIYTGEQKPDQKQDPNDYDYVFCGNDTPSFSIESDAASLLMEYNSGFSGGIFEANYEFVVDFRIPGNQSSPGCDYIYRSELLKTGTFNSPRHPSWYINDMNCSYTFITKTNEALILQFNTFKMFNSFDEKVLGYNEACKGEDLVEIFEFTPEGDKMIDQTEVGIYCGTTTPGPLISYRSVRVNFRANKEKVHYGFSAGYNFYPNEVLKTNEFVTNCGGQIQANQRQRSGVIASPETYRSETYEKRNHICSWNITARSSYKIALDFGKFELEGSPAVRGCITASVRLNTGKSKVPTELCGTIANSPSNGSTHQYVSENEWLTITFISTKQASGSNGFTATWTEIKRAS